MIRPQRLEAVQEALYDLDIYGLTVSEVRGMGRMRGITHTFRGSQYAQNLSPRLKLELVLNDEQVEDAVAAIRESAETGEIGDGKIFLIPVSDALRIRTGERGRDALA
ncbi:MAG: P-II family nitrogen regulator [Fimbriimonas sp.]